jgi:hypothetical protein
MGGSARMAAFGPDRKTDSLSYVAPEAETGIREKRFAFGIGPGLQTVQLWEEQSAHGTMLPVAP